jgi:hypothetical protein
MKTYRIIALDFDGVWREETFVITEDEKVVMGNGGELIILDAINEDTRGPYNIRMCWAPGTWHRAMLVDSVAV